MQTTIPKHKLPIPTRAMKSAVHAFAERAATRFEYAPGGAIERVVSALGGSIEHSDPFDDELPESIHVRDYLKFTVYISSFTSSRRDRFTIAHELGHYMLHFPKVREVDPTAEMYATRWVDEGNDDQRRAEWEANWFAAGFLMPSEEFSRLIRERGLEDAAEHFGVSVSAAKIRANSLGIL